MQKICQQGSLARNRHHNAPERVHGLLQPGRGFLGHTMFLGCWKAGDFSSQAGI